MKEQASIIENENQYLKDFTVKIINFNNKINESFKLIDDRLFFDGLLKKEIFLNMNKKIILEINNLKNWSKDNFLKQEINKWIKESILNVNKYFDFIEIKVKETLEKIGNKIASSNYLDKPYPYRKNSKLWRYDLISTEVFNTINEYDFYIKIHSEELNYYLQELKLLKNDLLNWIKEVKIDKIINSEKFKKSINNLVFLV